MGISNVVWSKYVLYDPCILCTINIYVKSVEQKYIVVKYVFIIIIITR